MLRGVEGAGRDDAGGALVPGSSEVRRPDGPRGGRALSAMSTRCRALVRSSSGARGFDASTRAYGSARPMLPAAAHACAASSSSSSNDALDASSDTRSAMTFGSSRFSINDARERR